jgi:hypothetical protein
MSLLRGTPGRVLDRLASMDVTFTYYARAETESADGLVQSGYGSAAGQLAGVLVAATPDERQRYDQSQHVIRRALVVSGAVAVAVGDRLVRSGDGRVFYAAEVSDDNGLGTHTRILLEERSDAQA